MELLLNTMKPAFPKLNQEPYGMEYAEKIARQEKIKITFAPYGGDIMGYFCTDRRPKRPAKHIVINSNLGEIMRTFTVFHELGHYFLHVPASSDEWFYCRRSVEQRLKKHDCEADIFALLAIMPLPLFFELAASENIEPELIPLCLQRQKIWEMSGR